MSAVLLVAHHERAEATGLCDSAIRWLHERGHRVVMTADDAAAVGASSAQVGAYVHGDSVDLAVSLGGDGTMLRTISILSGAPVPVMGVNLGLLGYLTEVDPGDFMSALGRWESGPESGRWSVDERMMLSITVHRSDGAVGPTFTALNEAVLEKQETGHTIRMLVTIDDSVFTSYAADGLILATPTGSTAYSMSARGPVVSPRLRAMLVTPVSPHMLFDRTLVLDPGETVGVEILGHRAAALSIDGQPGTTLVGGDRITAVPSPHVARLLRFGDRRFHQVLTAKFGLTER
ncbi:MAG: NAD(+)/NADH kinase [Ilumatobacteraceae bacterium]